MPDDQVDLHDEILPCDENPLNDDEYVDYSATSDTGGEDADSSDMNDDMGSSTGRTDVHTNIDNEEHNRLFTEPEGTRPQEELQVEPTVVHFPGRRAGEVRSEGITSMQEYENALGGPSENHYSPFGSEIDWELAKWAKLRGPSATSFTELLNISGVSLINRPLHFIISPSLSSCTNN